MKAKKIIFLFLFPLVAEVVVSCCNCLEPVFKHYTNKTLTVSNLDNSGSAPVVATSDTIRKTAYGIRMQLVRETVVCNEKPVSLFIQSAYAFKCGCESPYQILPRDSILSVSIVTLNDFDASHPANSDVTSYFRVYENFYFTIISDYLQHSELIAYNDSELQITADLLLMTPPAIDTQHKFVVNITLSDGRTFTRETSEIHLIS
jgi:hypothetical protein